MADKPDMAEIAGFNKAKLKTMETQEKNTLPTKETIEKYNGDFSISPAVKTLHFHCRGAGSMPGRGRSHMP
uniref:Thymosin beta-10 n=1 Tax=Monodon monoceros TaxID=40151 RepID=A0A8C6ATE7_MONMO